ncbi:hypothetical protein ROA7023_04655 [Roseisalinus antarcticus]|uniref:Uncharacterized protein n=1 Tax=Roseisalinus antarcticus TaxID=254357 RepID=A0A1Y5U0H0_9RHOB|nr:hypothetical protein ROA7023_04655 [Roseisalinus antarcticus]
MSRQWAFEGIVRKEANHLLRTFVDGAANGGSEPRLTDAALCANGR